MIHYKCRNNEKYYPSSKDVKRIFVPEVKISWKVDWPEYNAPDYTSPHISDQSWADPDINDTNFKPQWNSMDAGIDRISFDGTYDIVNSRPRNIVGRTGLQGRGILGRWGPNKAADPIVTRWKTTVKGEKVRNKSSNKFVLQFVAIERRDNSEWAIPGGMVNPGEQVGITLKREFMEESLNILTKNESEITDLKARVERFFMQGKPVYKGYVDDPRNTDNAWIETTAVHYHDETNESVGLLPFEAGDDASKVQWMDIDRNMNLYASHYMFLKTVAENAKAHW